MKPHVTIRPATTADIPAMYQISLAAHQRGYDMFIPVSRLADFHRRYQSNQTRADSYAVRTSRFISDPDRHAIVAEIDGQIVGYHLAQIVSSDNAQLKGLFVDPDAQGKGVGRALFAATMEALPGKTVTLDVIAANTRARTLYESFGFHDEPGETASFYGAPLITMTTKKQR